MSLPKAPARGVRTVVFPTKWEVLLARMLLRVCDKLDWNEPDEQDLYNEVKPLAETVLRSDPRAEVSRG